ncbi:MAG: hypothetical protein M3R61_02685 [Chloroflexota bacterium]|nr:hypothetical protein [Chloroflexota bacterium]
MGLDLGLEAAGIETALCIESDRWSCETVRANRPRLPLFAQLAALIETSNAPLHAYQRRHDDLQGNAKESYLVDVRALECLYERV